MSKKHYNVVTRYMELTFFGSGQQFKRFLNIIGKPKMGFFRQAGSFTAKESHKKQEKNP